jgi:hypothetical protein
MRAETAQEYRQRVARGGGNARAAKLTAKQRADSARKAALARWAKNDLGEQVAQITEGTKTLLRKAKKRPQK